jgi:hypothetical protein
LSHSPNDFGWKQSRFGFLEKSDWRTRKRNGSTA